MRLLGILSTSTQAPAVGGTPVLDLRLNGTNGSTTYTDETGRHVPANSGGSGCSLSTTRYASSPSSLYNNGTGGFVALTDNAGDFIYTGNFYISFDYYTENANHKYLFMLSNSDGSAMTGANEFSAHFDGGEMLFEMSGLGRISMPMMINTWSNFKIRRENGIWIFYKDNQIMGYGASDAQVGLGNCYLLGSNYYGGQLSNLDNVYIEAVPPSNAIAANFKVLDLKFNGTNGSTTFTDDTGRHTMSANGSNVSLSTSQYVSSPSSLYRGAVSVPNYVSTQYNIAKTDFVFFGDFLISFSLYSPAINDISPIVKIYGNNTLGVNNLELLIESYSLSLYVNGTLIVSSGLTTNTWYSVKVRRLDDLITLYVNGVLAGSTNVQTYFGDGKLHIGGYIFEYPGYQECYIDDFYVESSAYSYTDTSYVDFPVLDCKFNGTNLSTTFTDDTGRNTVQYTGEIWLSTTQFSSSPSSLYKNNNTGYAFVAPANDDFVLVGDFLISFDYRIENTTSKIPFIFTNNPLTDGSGATDFYLTSASNTISLKRGSTTLASVSINTSTFTKFKIIRRGNNITFYKNNVFVKSVIDANQLGSGNLYIMGNDEAGGGLNGRNAYLDNLYITNNGYNLHCVQELIFNGANGTNLFSDVTGRHPIGIGAGLPTHNSTSELNSPVTNGYLTGDCRGIHNDFIFTGNYIITMVFRAANTTSISVLVNFGGASGYTVVVDNGVVKLYQATTLVLTTSNSYSATVNATMTLKRIGTTTTLLLNENTASQATTTSITGTIGDGNIWYGNQNTVVTTSAAIVLDNVQVFNYGATQLYSYALALQLMFNGSNGGTIFSSNVGGSSTIRTGTGTVSTTQFYEGSASYLSPAGNNYLTTTVSAQADIALFTWEYDFSIMFWFRPTSTTVSSVLFSFTDFALKTTATGQQITLAISGTHGSTNMVPSNTWTNNAWNKVEFKRVGTTTYLILNDDTANQATISTAGMQTIITPVSGGIKWGNQTAIVASPAAVNIDNIIITKGYLT